MTSDDRDPTSVADPDEPGPRSSHVAARSERKHLPVWQETILLLGIALTGLGMKFLMHVDVIAVKAFFLGLMRLEILPLPAHPGLYLHLGMVVLLMVVFPVSKLLHAPGVFFSPTRNQVDNPRETRHLAPWATQLESK